MLSNPEETDPLLARSATKHPTFEVDDPKDPRNWSRFRKWFMVAIILPIDLSVSWGASGFSPVSSDFAKDIGVSPQVATLGLSLYVLGLAFGPMTLAPLSETFGRVPIYILSYATFLVLLLSTTYTDHLAPFLVLRLFSGYFASTTISNFGGTIADIFHHHETGPAMSWFLWAATGGSPTGFVLFSFIGHDRSWRDTLRIMSYICFAFWIAMSTSLLLLGETRHNVILLRRAKADGVEVTEHDDNVQPRTPGKLVRTALLRPFRFLGTEAIVQFAALYNGFLYGLSFLFNGAFHIIFGPRGYGFNTSQIGLCFLGIVFGICAGLFTNIFQERYYQRVTQNGHREAPEARIHLSKAAAIVLPISLLAFGLLAEPNIPPYYAIAASAFWGWSFYTLILMTLIYTEDAYKTYSASALAGIGLIRNVGGAGIPIVGRSLFLNLGTRNASFVLTAIAVCLAPIPFVLDSKGSSLRRRSPWAAAHAELDDDAE